ncbi:MAG: tetratricopeptide repeat protein [Magnetococcales bacterium]|nr:tetratricopeptide repeat protein [Magnetococcales bacterium]
MNDAGEDSARLARSLALGVRLLESNRLEEAEELLAKVIVQYPNAADGWHQAGLVAFRRGEGKLSVARISQAITLNSTTASYYNSLAGSLWLMDRKKESQETYLKAINIAPDKAQYYSNYGLASLKLGEHQLAISSLLNAIKLDNKLVSAWIFLGETLEELDRLEEALNAFSNAVALSPDNLDGVFGLTLVLIKDGQHKKADAILDSSLVKYPENPHLHYKKGLVSRELGYWQKAEVHFQKAIEIAPTMAAAQWNYCHLLPGVMEDKGEYDTWRNKMAKRLDFLQNYLKKSDTTNINEFYKWVGGSQSFYLAYHLENNLALLNRCGEINRTIMSHWAKQHDIRQTSPLSSSLTQQRPIKLGIVSSSIRYHSVWNAFLAGLVEQLDSNLFEIVLFHTDKQRDEVTQQAINSCEEYIAETSVQAMASVIVKCQPDILLYADLGLKPINEQLASLRLAKVQMTTWGHPDSSGRSTIDYFLSGELLEPNDGEDHYSETLVRAPNLGCYIEPAVTNLDKSQQALQLIADNAIDANKHIIYISPHAPFKYPAAYDQLYPDIAKQVKNARFIFFEYFRNHVLSDLFKKRLLKAFAKKGLDGEKFIHFLPWQNQQGFHALLSTCHIYLDTCGFSGFNTALQGLECGLPVVTLKGPALRHRLASGLLSRIAVTQTIANTPAQWLKIAIRLGEDSSWRDDITAAIRTNLHKLYRDREPIDFLNNFFAHTVKDPQLAKQRREPKK